MAGLPEGWGKLGASAGLMHAYSGTCAIDIDQLAEAITLMLLAYGIDLQALLDAPDAVQIVSGRDNRAKLLYKMPEGLVLPTTTLKVGVHHALQFRCGTKNGLTVQDVLPPSWHPDTDRPYEWGGKGDFRNLPEIPAALLQVWQGLVKPPQRARTGRSSPGRGVIPPETLEGVEMPKIQAALAVLDPDMNRDDWLKVGMALHAADPDLFGVWDEWSRGGHKYDDDPRQPRPETIWNGFGQAGGAQVALGTLYRMADQAVRKNPLLGDWRRASIDVQALFRGQVSAQAPASIPILSSSGRLGTTGSPAPTSTGCDLPGQGLTSYDELLEQAMRLRPLDDVRPLLIQAIGLTPVEQDRLVATISDQASVGRVAVRAELRQLERAAQRGARDEQPQGPVFRWLSEQGFPKPHLDNFASLLAYHGVVLKYNEMTHEAECSAPGMTWLQDNWKNQQVTFIKDKMVEVGMPVERCKELMDAYAAANTYHPFRQDLAQVTWDGVSRWDWVKETLETPHPEARDLFLRKWLISIMAAVYRSPHQPPPRGVLCFYSAQGKGKTRWLQDLLPPGLFREGATLLPGNKDSEKQALGHLVVELGEIEETFKGGRLGLLKAWISKGIDELRTPYAASESTWPRRTVYAGTVNHRDFLKDLTGNTRFWPIEVTQFGWRFGKLLPQGDDLLQFWKEVEDWFRKGESYHLTPAELALLEEHNEAFRDVSPLEEAVLRHYRWDAPKEEWAWLGRLEIYEAVDHHGKHYRDVGQLHDILRKLLHKYTGQEHAQRRYEDGERRRKWLMPPARHLYQNFDVIPGGKQEE